MSNYFGAALVLDVSINEDRWIGVTLKVSPDSKTKYVNSRLGPDYGYQEEFFQRTGVSPRNIRSLIGKTIIARFYKGRDGEWKLAPDSITIEAVNVPAPVSAPVAAPVVATPLTHKPFADVAGKIPAPPPNAPREDFKKAVETAKTTEPAKAAQALPPTPIKELETELKKELQEAEQAGQEMLKQIECTEASYKKLPPDVKRFDTSCLNKLVKELEGTLKREGIGSRLFHPEILKTLTEAKALLLQELGARKLHTK